jgi:O-Antigen ligase
MKQPSKKTSPTNREAAVATTPATGSRSFFTPLGVERGILACYVGLWTISLLATSDAPPGLGMFVVQSFLWSLLACGLAAFYVWQPQRMGRWNKLDSAVSIWLVWTGITTFAVLGIGDMRAAVNGFWQSVSFGTAILIGRRLLHSPERRTAAMVLLIGLICLLAAHGLYQYTVITPDTIRRIEADPQSFLKQAGVEGDVASPEAQTFLNRAKSREPLATFALTNTLAGCLLPGLVLMLCALYEQRKAGTRLPYATICFWLTILVVLTLCLLLTKSRTAVLSLFAGGLIVALRQWRIDWRWLAGGSMTIALLLVAMFVSGGWDREVLSEAPKSVLYRLEYWYSTLGMIRDHWLLGVALGNFQSVYTQYMLPQASEEIADPHNFILEIAATTGLPGLLLFSAWLTILVCEACSVRQADLLRSEENSCAPISDRKRSAWRIQMDPMLLLGGIGGLLLTPLVMQIGEAGIDTLLGVPLLWLFGIPLLCVLYWWSGRTHFFASITPLQLLLALAVLLINLLAAGGINFPSVAMLIALLAGMLSPSEFVREESERTPLSARFAPLIAFLLLYVLGAGCYWCCYAPVLGARRLMHEAMELETTKQYSSSFAKRNEATLVDPWETAFLVHLVDLHHELEYAYGESRFIRELIRRNPRRSKTYEQIGDLAFDHFDKLSGMYEIAIEHFPNSAMLHAKNAWFHFNAATRKWNSRTEVSDIVYLGDKTIMINEARKALELDQLMPHTDKKLASTLLDSSRFGDFFRFDPDRNVLENPPNYEEAMQLILKVAPNRPPQESN